MTGLLALSVAAGTSVASEPDRQQEGISAPEQVSSPAPGAPTETPGESADPVGPPTDDPAGDDLGQGSGGETALPFEAAPVPRAPQDNPSEAGPDEGLPLETEPIDDPDGRLTLTDPDTPPVDDVVVPPTEPTPALPSPPAAPPFGAEDQTESSELQPPSADPDGRSDGERRRRDKAPRHDAEPPRRDEGAHGGGKPRVQERHDGASTPAAAPAPSSADAQVLNVATPPEPVAPPAGTGRFHLVRPGESLWRIAAELLGRGASNAEIAREVHRLWELNKDRIASGDPNLLGVGVTLRLR